MMIVFLKLPIVLKRRREVLKEKPIIFSTAMVKAIIAGTKSQTRRIIKTNLEIETDKNDKNYFYVQDEYGDGHKLLEYCPYKIGQILWVRETYTDTLGDDIIYKAGWDGDKEPKWKPGIFMPRTIARVFLKLTNIRIERVQDITEKDVYAEGIPKNSLSFKNSFIYLWNSINLKRGYGWEINPFVWVYDFKKVKM